MKFKQKSLKRGIATILALVLILGMLPVTVFAASDDTIVVAHIREINGKLVRFDIKDLEDDVVNGDGKLFELYMSGKMIGFVFGEKNDPDSETYVDGDAVETAIADAMDNGKPLEEIKKDAYAVNTPVTNPTSGEVVEIFKPQVSESGEVAIPEQPDVKLDETGKGSEIIAPDKSGLVKQIGLAESLLAVTVAVEDDDEDVAVGTWLAPKAAIDALTTAIGAAKAVAENAEADLETVKGAIDVLGEAMETFKAARAKKVAAPVEPDVDTEAYDALVAKAAALVETDYTADSWALYQAAIAECDLTLTAEDGQDAIDAAVVDITAALALLVEAEKPVDPADAAIKAANDALAALQEIEAVDEENYAAAVAAVKAAEDALAALVAAEVSEEDYDTTALNEALEAVKEFVDEFEGDNPDLAEELAAIAKANDALEAYAVYADAEAIEEEEIEAAGDVLDALTAAKAALAAIAEPTDEEAVSDLIKAIDEAAEKLEALIEAAIPADVFTLISVVPAVNEDTVTVTATFKNVPETEDAIEVEFYLFNGDTEIEFNETATAAIDEDGIAEVEFVELSAGTYNVTVTVDVDGYDEISKTVEDIIVKEAGEETVTEKLKKAAAAADKALEELDIEAIADDADALAELRETLEELYDALDEAFDAYLNDEEYEEDEEYEAAIAETLEALTDAIVEVDDAIELIELITVTDVEVVSATEIKVTVAYDKLNASDFTIALTSTPATTIEVTKAVPTTATETVPGYYTLTLKSSLVANADYTLTIKLNGKEIYNEAGLVNEQLEAISGVVKAYQGDTKDGALLPLVGATVTIKDSKGDEVDVQITDEDGKYETAKLLKDPTIKYDIEVIAEGYTGKTVAPVLTGATGDITAKSSSIKLFSDDSNVAVIDLEKMVIKLPESASGAKTGAKTLADVLTVQYTKTQSFTIHKKDELNADIKEWDIALEDGYVVKVVAEDGENEGTYTIEYIDPEEYLDVQVMAVTLKPGTAAGTVTLVGTTEGMFYQKVAGSASASSLIPGTPATTGDISAKVGEKIVVYAGSYASNGIYNSLVIGFNDLQPADAPVPVFSGIAQGATANTAAITVTNALTTWEYQVGKTAEKDGVWTAFKGTAPLNLEADTDYKLFVRVAKTLEQPASKETAGEPLEVRPGTLNFTAAANTTDTGTVITGLTPGTAPATTFAYQIFEGSQDGLMRPAKGSTIGAAYTAIENKGVIKTLPTDDGKYLVVVEVSSGKLVNWAEVKITPAMIKQTMPAVTIKKEAYDDDDVLNAGKTKLTVTPAKTGNMIYISTAATAAVPANWEVGASFVGISGYKQLTLTGEQAQKTGSYAFPAAGTYVVVEVTSSGTIAGASTLKIEAKDITYVIKVTDNRDTSKNISYYDGSENPTITIKNNVGCYSLAGPVTGTELKFGNDQTYGSSTAHYVVAAAAVGCIYNVTISNDTQWEYNFAKDAKTYNIVKTATAGVDSVNIEKVVGGIKIGTETTTYKIPSATSNATLNNLLTNLQIGDSFKVEEGGAVSEITVKDGATLEQTEPATRIITVSEAECHEKLTITGGKLTTLLLQTAKPFTTGEGKKSIEVAGGSVQFQSTNFGEIAIGERAETVIKASPGLVFTGISGATSVTINGYVLDDLADEYIVTVVSADKLSIGKAEGESKEVFAFLDEQLKDSAKKLNEEQKDKEEDFNFEIGYASIDMGLVDVTFKNVKGIGAIEELSDTNILGEIATYLLTDAEDGQKQKTRQHLLLTQIDAKLNGITTTKGEGGPNEVKDHNITTEKTVIFLKEGENLKVYNAGNELTTVETQGELTKALKDAVITLMFNGKFEEPTEENGGDANVQTEEEKKIDLDEVTKLEIKLDISLYVGSHAKTYTVTFELNLIDDSTGEEEI